MPSLIQTPAGSLMLYGVAGAPTKQDAPRGNGCRDWVRSTRQASFKGIPFEVAEDSKEGGRRLAIHTYPNRDTYDVEDLGKEVITYSVQAHVIGDDADQYRDMLYAACSDFAGPGLLVLPLYRPIQAWLAHVTATNVYDEFGRIPVQMEFVEEVRPQGGLFSSTFHQNVVSQAAATAATAINDSFSLSFDTVVRGFSDINFVPAIARVTASEEIERAADALDLARSGVAIGDRLAAANVQWAIRKMRKAARYLAYRGHRPNRYETDTFILDQAVIKSGLSSLVSGAVRRMATYGETAEAVYSSLSPLTRYQAQAIERAAVGRARSERAETVLTGEIANLLRRHSAVRLADVATRQRYRTRQDAAQVKADLAQLFQAEAADTDEIDLKETFAQVMEGVTDFLSQEMRTAPNALRLRAGSATPACVAAYQLYTDASKGPDIIALNGRSTHPLFLPPEFAAPIDLTARRALA